MARCSTKDIKSDGFHEMRVKMRKKTDQRVVLTQMLLKNALVDLMQEHHISKISVRAICDVADINRSTFYVHFKDQYDLLQKVQHEVIENLTIYLAKQEFNNNKPLSVQTLARILDYFKENEELFKALLSENGDFGFQKDLLEFAQVISAQQNLAFNEKTQEYIKTFSLTGIISILQMWLQDGLEEPSTQMAEFIIQLLYFGLSSIKSDALGL